MPERDVPPTATLLLASRFGNTTLLTTANTHSHTHTTHTLAHSNCTGDVYHAHHAHREFACASPCAKTMRILFLFFLLFIFFFAFDPDFCLFSLFTVRFLATTFNKTPPITSICH